jgi:hypothetical protein
MIRKTGNQLQIWRYCMKYIAVALDEKESIFIFPSDVDHDRMAEAIEAIRFRSRQNWSRKFRTGEVIAAGFVTGGVCHGRSETLDLDSRGKVDTALLRAALSNITQPACLV